MTKQEERAGEMRVVLVDIIAPDVTKEEAEKRLEEMENLVKTYGGFVVVKCIQKRSLPDYESYMGKGKALEIFGFAEEERIDFVITNNILKARQIFKLNEIFRKVNVKAWDRVDLILKIFSKHAKSAEAKLQIELASIKHMGPRIFDMGIELSRQGGAMGMRAGQGESNTEMMKRHLRTQELNILKKLHHYELIREGHRKRRRRQNFKTAALVGYTNAGKSSILNALTGKGAYVADQLFATLDTRVGKLFIPETYEEILISDTIGFIQNLPPDLIQAFKSTLSETVDADLILHVIDVTDDEIQMKIKVVEEILQQIGASDKPKIYVFNKIDMIEEKHLLLQKFTQKTTATRPDGILKAGKQTAEYLGWEAGDTKPESIIDTKRLAKQYAKYSPIFISAHSGERLEELKAIISGLIAK